MPVLYERMAHGEAGKASPVLTQSLDRPRYFRADGSPWAIFADIAPASPVERLSQFVSRSFHRRQRAWRSLRGRGL